MSSTSTSDPGRETRSASPVGRTRFATIGSRGPAVLAEAFNGSSFRAGPRLDERANVRETCGAYPPEPNLFPALPTTAQIRRGGAVRYHGWVSTVNVTPFSDPGCPWAYSASPALAVLRWRYGDQLNWRLAMVGLTETPDQYERRGYTTEGSALGRTIFRRYGMPLAPAPKRSVSATSPACRVVVAARLRAPEREDAVFRALQFAQFTTGALLDDPDDLCAALDGVPGVDAAALVAARDDDDVWAAYDADKAATRTAEGSPTAAQGKAAATDGPVRYTAPSLIFTRNGQRLEAGGFQPVEAYDVVIANLAPDLERRDPPEDVADLLAAFPDGLTTQEIAAVRAWGNEPPDRREAERALISLVAHGKAERVALGDDALWRPAS